jgi:hypothetical protein
MCENCNWEDYIEAMESALSDLVDLPDRAADFAVSVEEKLVDIKCWVEDNGHITDAQARAVDNMIAGIQKWIR